MMILSYSLDELMEDQMMQYYQIVLNIHDRAYIYIYIYIDICAITHTHTLTRIYIGTTFIYIYIYIYIYISPYTHRYLQINTQAN